MNTVALPAETEILDRAREENFPVALRVLPAETRRHLFAIYGFARLVDYIGDDAPGERLALLDAVARDLDRIYTGRTPHESVLVTLARTIHELALPPEPFHRLLEANRIDQRVRRYVTFSELCEYCTLSANPVGHLVLHVFEACTPARMALSDRVCTALQLVEHWQDVGEDMRRGRIYLPLEDMERFGCSERDLSAAVASSALRALLAFEVARTRALLAEGAELVAMLGGWARLAVAGFVAGGHAALDAIRSRGFEVLERTPRPNSIRRARRLVQVLIWPTSGGRAADKDW